MTGLAGLPGSLWRVARKQARAWRPRRAALPTFLVIGAMKAGTSSLHRYLGSHPDVWASPVKETDWFLAPGQGGRTTGGLDWYRHQFDARSPARGETSPNYAKRHLFPGVPERVHGVAPDVRLVYVVRDPIERAISHWRHNVANGRADPEAFERAMQPRPRHPIWATSRYHFQLLAWLEWFDLDDILVVTAEDLRDHRRATLAEVFTFLGVDPTHDSDTIDRMVHVTGAGPDAPVPGARPGTGRGDGEVAPPPPRPTVSPAMRERARDLLRPDVDRLRALTGRALGEWSV